MLTLRPGADREAIRAELQTAVDAATPALSATVSERRDVATYRVLYDDIDSDAQLWRIIALLVLAAASFAELNLTTHIVEAERREIGVGMALGVSPCRLAVRPLRPGLPDDLIGRAVLEEVPRRTGVQRITDPGLVTVRRQHDDPTCRVRRQ